MPGAEGPDVVTSSLVMLGWALCGKGVRRQPQGSLPTACLVALWLAELWGQEAVRGQGGERAVEKRGVRQRVTGLFVTLSRGLYLGTVPASSKLTLPGGCDGTGQEGVGL